MSDLISEAVKSFIGEVMDYVDYEVPRAALKFQKDVYYAAIKMIIKRTPVKTGRARANWQVTRGGFSNAGPFKKTDKDGDETIAKAWRVVNRMRAYESCYFTNNVPYIERLEEGWSKQAPPGYMVRQTLEELKLIYGLES